MGRKSSKKASRPGKAGGKQTGKTPEDGRRGSSRADGRPEAPWGRFPLMEIAVLVGLIMIGAGLFTGSPVPLLGGLLVASVGGLELSVREHFAGYRSHTTLLAFVAGVGVACLGLFGFGLDVRYSFAAGVLAFAILFALLRRAFIKASGGLSYRIR